MTVLVKPILHDSRDSTAYRLYSLFQPIQKTDRKASSDFAAYLLTPLADIFVLDSLYTLNASINFMNASLSLLNAIYIWTNTQQHQRDLFDERTVTELQTALNQLSHGFNDLFAAVFNPIISVLCLATRPIASVVHALAGEEPSRGYAMG